MNDIEATKVIAVLQAAFPHPALTEDRYRLYVTKLLPLDFRAATKAVDRLTDELDFFPTVAQLKKAIGDAGGLAPMLPAGTETERKSMMVYQVFDVDADDYLPLAVPVPLHSDEGQELMRLSTAALIEAGIRDAAKTAEAA